MKYTLLVLAITLSVNLLGQDNGNVSPQNCDSLTAHFAAKEGGVITLKELTLAQGVSIKSMGTCLTKVLSYTVSLNNNQLLNRGGYLTAESKELLKHARTGDKVLFEFIKIKGSTDGVVRDLGTISFTVN